MNAFFSAAANEVGNVVDWAAAATMVVGAVVLWKAAKAGFSALKAHVEHERELEKLVKDIPKPLRLEDFLNRPRP